MTEEQLSIQTVQLLYICNKSLVDETVRNDIDVTLNIGHYLGLHRSNDSRSSTANLKVLNGISVMTFWITEIVDNICSDDSEETQTDVYVI